MRLSSGNYSLTTEEQLYTHTRIYIEFHYTRKKSSVKLTHILAHCTMLMLPVL